MNSSRVADLLLRISVAFAFLYPPVSALQDPSSWIGYLPAFVRGWAPELVLLHSFGVVEVLLALWILSGWKIFYPALLTAAMLGGIVLFNLGEFPILFRDLSIAAAALALALLHYPKKALQI